MGRRQSKDLVRLEPEVAEVRPWRRLDGNVDLRIVADREEAATDEPKGRHGERGEERSGRERHHRPPVIERPRDDLAVIARLTVEPVVELVELLRDPPLLVLLAMRI